MIKKIFTFSLLKSLTILIIPYALADCSDVTIQCINNNTKEIVAKYQANRQYNWKAASCELMKNNSYWVGLCNKDEPKCQNNCRAEQK